MELHQTVDKKDASKIKEYMTCQRKYFYRYILGWESTAPRNDLVFGQAWHHAQEYLLLNDYSPESVNIAFQEHFLPYYRKYFDESTDSLFGNKIPSRALVALAEYTEKWKNDHREFEVLHTEINATVPITESERLYLRMDSILRDRSTDLIFSMDHKTSKTLSRFWTDQWALSVQVGTYTHALYCLYPIEQVRGIKISGTFFPSAKKVDFERVPCWKSFDQMQVWLTNMLYWLGDLKRQTEVLMEEDNESNPTMYSFPLNPESCTKYFGCPYHDFCTAWRNPIRRSYEPPLGFEVSFWDPEEEIEKERIDLRWPLSS